jgi:hypothetical protein
MMMAAKPVRAGNTVPEVEFISESEFDHVASESLQWSRAKRVSIGASIVVAIGAIVLIAANISSQSFRVRPEVIGSDLVSNAERAAHHPDRTCHTASASDADTAYAECYEHVLWGMNIGIRSNPEWYKVKDKYGGEIQLTTSSLFEEFQYNLYQARHHNWVCPQPCPKGSAHIYYAGKIPDDYNAKGPPDFTLKYGECTYDGGQDNHMGANMLMADFNPMFPSKTPNYIAEVCHWDNVFCTGKPKCRSQKTDGDKSSCGRPTGAEWDQWYCKVSS